VLRIALVEQKKETPFSPVGEFVGEAAAPVGYVKLRQSLNVAAMAAAAVFVSPGNVALTRSGDGPRFSILLNRGYRATPTIEPRSSSNTAEMTVRVRFIL
jgi:hypothetical protein